MRGYILAALIAIGVGGCVAVPADYVYYHNGPYYTHPYPYWGGSYYYYDDGPRHKRHRHGRHHHRGWDRD